MEGVRSDVPFQIGPNDVNDNLLLEKYELNH